MDTFQATKGNKAPEKAKPAKPKSDIVVKSGRQAAQERKAAEAEAARKQVLWDLLTPCIHVSFGIDCSEPNELDACMSP